MPTIFVKIDSIMKDYFEHKEGVFTNYYPHESLPIPDNGRYRLHNEIDDCIVCDAGRYGDAGATTTTYTAVWRDVIAKPQVLPATI